MKQKFVNLVMRFLLKRYFKTYSFVEFPDEEIWSKYHKMNTPDILDVLQHRFTNIFVDHYSKGGDTFLMAKGRIFELMDLMSDIEGAEDKLLRITEIKRKQAISAGMMSQLGQISPNKIKNKLLGFARKTKPSKPEE